MNELVTIFGETFGVVMALIGLLAFVGSIYRRITRRWR